MGCLKLTHHLTAESRLRCVYNVADNEASGGSTTERWYLGGTAYDAPAVAIRTDGGA